MATKPKLTSRAAWSITLVLVLVHLALIFVLEPAILGMYVAVGGAVPVVTRLIVQAPRIVRVLQILGLGPGMLGVLEWRLDSGSPWLFTPAVSLLILIPLEILALFVPMFLVTTIAS